MNPITAVNNSYTGNLSNISERLSATNRTMKMIADKAAKNTGSQRDIFISNGQKNSVVVDTSELNPKSVWETL